MVQFLDKGLRGISVGKDGHNFLWLHHRFGYRIHLRQDKVHYDMFSYKDAYYSQVAFDKGDRNEVIHDSRVRFSALFFHKDNDE
jgi:hypothetical protein